MSKLIELADPAPGCLSTEWAIAIVGVIVLLMLVVASSRRSVRRLLTSNEVYFWLGGLILMSSGLVVDFIGPWGASMSPYTTLTWNWGFPKIFYSLPRISSHIFGLVVASAAFASVLCEYSMGQRAKWICTGAGVVLILLGWFVTTIWAHGGKLPLPMLWWCAAELTFIAVLSLPLFITQDEVKRGLWITLIPASILLIEFLAPVFSMATGRSSWDVYRAGFWIKGVGLIIIFIGCVNGLRHMSNPSIGNCLACDYNLTGNTSGICPECGTPIAVPEKISSQQPDAHG